MVTGPWSRCWKMDIPVGHVLCRLSDEFVRLSSAMAALTDTIVLFLGRVCLVVG